MTISHLKIENNSCDYSMTLQDGYTSGLLLRYIEGDLSVSNTDIIGNTCNW